MNPDNQLSNPSIGKGSLKSRSKGINQVDESSKKFCIRKNSPLCLIYLKHHILIYQIFPVDRLSIKEKKSKDGFQLAILSVLVL